MKFLGHKIKRVIKTKVKFVSIIEWFKFMISKRFGCQSCYYLGREEDMGDFGECYGSYPVCDAIFNRYVNNKVNDELYLADKIESDAFPFMFVPCECRKLKLWYDKKKGQIEEEAFWENEGRKIKEILEDK